MMVCSFRELKVQYGRSGVWQPEGMIVVGSGSSQSMFILYYLIKIYGFLFWSCCFPSSVPSRSSTLTQLSVLSIFLFLDNGKKQTQNTKHTHQNQNLQNHKIGKQSAMIVNSHFMHSSWAYSSGMTLLYISEIVAMLTFTFLLW